jgi:KDO2-lipid IV(A) lauroyltransferase
VATWFESASTHLQPLPIIEPPATGRLRDKVLAMTQAFAASLGEQVRAHPEDWHMLQPFWLDDVQRARDQREARR